MWINRFAKIGYIVFFVLFIPGISLAYSKSDMISSDPVKRDVCSSYAYEDVATTTPEGVVATSSQEVCQKFTKAREIKVKFYKNRLKNTIDVGSYYRTSLIGKDKYHTRIFLGENHEKKGNTWYTIEEVVMSEQSYDDLIKTTLLDVVLGFPVYAQSTTTYTILDGKVKNYSLSSWSDARDNSSNTSVSYSNNYEILAQTRLKTSPSEWQIQRGFYNFNNVIPDDATITSADINFKTQSITNEVNDGNDYITVIQANNASTTALLTTDYDKITYTELTGDRLDLTTMSADTWYSFDFNSAGLSWIDTASSYLKFAFITGYDNENSVISSPGKNIVVAYTHESADDPYLDIVYTLPGGPEPTPRIDVITCSSSMVGMLEVIECQSSFVIWLAVFIFFLICLYILRRTLLKGKLWK